MSNGDLTWITSFIWNIADDSYCVCATLENGTGNANVPASTVCTWDSLGTYYCAQNKQ